MAGIANELSNLADVERIIVAFGLRLRMSLVRVFPRLPMKNSIDCRYLARPWKVSCNTDLRESTIIPNITVVRETVADKTKFALFDVLLDRIEGFLLGYFHFGVGPARHFDDHIQDAIVAICK